MHDVVIRGGFVVDGTGAPGREADVAIDNGRIAAVGSISARGREEIDARGGYILPGLIDTHVHVTGEGADLIALAQQPFSYMFYKAIQYLARTLECGVTTVRDAGGADAGVKKAVTTASSPGRGCRSAFPC